MRLVYTYLKILKNVDKIGKSGIIELYFIAVKC